MSKALIITVGTGISVDHGIALSISHNKPDYIVFLATENSKKTIEKVEKTLSEFNFRLKSEKYKVVTIKDEASYKECYTKAKNVINFLRKEYDDIAVDYTSGTKAMSAGLLLAGILLGGRKDRPIEFCYVTGDRDERGVVIPGTERLVFDVSLHSSAVIDMNESLIKKMFNNYAFEDGLRILNEIKQKFREGAPRDLSELIEKLEKILQGYSHWDKFNHLLALTYIKPMDNSLIDVTRNKEFLLKIEKSNKENDIELETLLMVDLLNNAKRRLEEGKYDDAVARIYSLIEMIAQHCLRKFNIDTSNVDLWALESLRLEGSTVQKYEKLRDPIHENKIKLPLFKAYELINDIYKVNSEKGDCLSIGPKFFNDEKLRHLLSKRNGSILAHGKTPIDKVTAEELCKKAEEYLASLIPNFHNLSRDSQFPKFELLF